MGSKPDHLSTGVNVRYAMFREDGTLFKRQSANFYKSPSAAKKARDNIREYKTSELKIKRICLTVNQYE